MYSCGVWIVKEGKEKDFEQRWQAGADLVAIENPGTKFMLLQDRDDPRRFISLREGWRNVEQLEAARSLPSYQDRWPTPGACSNRVTSRGSISSRRSASQTSGSHASNSVGNIRLGPKGWQRPHLSAASSQVLSPVGSLLTRIRVVPDACHQGACERGSDRKEAMRCP
jgi:hypothetical protein